jgi:hypothetical protein
MCIEVTTPGGRKISTIGELRTHIAAELVLYEAYKEMPPDETCLCPINLDKTVQPLGWHLNIDEFGDITMLAEAAE